MNLLEAIKSAAMDMMEDPDFKPGADALWDLREAQIKNFSAEDLRSLVFFIAEHQAKRGAGYKVAIVAERDLLFGGARMFEAFADSLPFSCRVFRNVEDAEQWICIKP
ncbi:MAG: hypothetical protein N3B18_13240 [Desulfobacterota bacterium]|nr:hypothetical protein [Thermodesulfobacteriota bacterium]